MNTPLTDRSTLHLENTPPQPGEAAAPERLPVSPWGANGRRVVLPRATDPRSAPPNPALSDPALYFNRELSWLDFNWRVLYQAMDDRVPLLERARFLSIASTNMDEFFRKRVGGLKRQAAAGVSTLSPDGRTPEEQLVLTRAAVLKLQDTMCDTWAALREQLRAEIGVHVHDYDDLSEAERRHLYQHFQENIFPILTPLAVDPGHPFPFISNLSLSLAVKLRHPKRLTEHFARLKVPTTGGRWVALPEPMHYIAIEQVIAHNLHDLFRGMEVVAVSPFQITRNADLQRDEEEAEDLIEMIAEELRERRFAPVVRLEVNKRMPEDVRQLLLRELQLEPEDLYETSDLIDHSACAYFADMKLPQHRFEPWEPRVPRILSHDADAAEDHDLFSIIRAGDVLVHHPYESFNASVLRFVEAAADDPHVVAIKQTMYRTSDESPIMSALTRAAENGKQVAVLVEVKARFDEQNNIEWGQTLERSGAHVTYGLVGLKTHTKVTFVVRAEPGGLRTYCHIGTGNYNPKTARLYTDLGLLTADPVIGHDVTNLFHYLTGYAPEQHYRKLIIAPRDMRDRFLELLRREVAHHRAHGSGRVMAKMNGLDDIKMIREVYQASQEGVRIDLVVRGHCRLRPGVPGISENVRVFSILGRFLEHSRVYYFHNNGDPEILIGSADWQRRNLDDRVEAVIGVHAPEHKQRLTHLLESAIESKRSAWELQADGHYVLDRSEEACASEGYQEHFMRVLSERHRPESV